MMKCLRLIAACFFVLICTGCEEEVRNRDSDFPDTQIQTNCLFTPERIRFNQLTEFADDWQISAYVDMLDQFSSRIKAGGIWRFELYEYLPRSTEQKGARLYMWPDIKLTEAKANYELWQDYLRCYKFDLNIDIDLAADKTYILQAVCFTAQERRITDSVELKR